MWLEPMIADWKTIVLETSKPRIACPYNQCSTSSKSIDASGNQRVCAFSGLENYVRYGDDNESDTKHPRNGMI